MKECGSSVISLNALAIVFFDVVRITNNNDYLEKVSYVMEKKRL